MIARITLLTALLTAVLCFAYCVYGAVFGAPEDAPIYLVFTGVFGGMSVLVGLIAIEEWKK